MLNAGTQEVETTWSGGGGIRTGSTGSVTERCARVHRTLRRIVKARGALDAQEAAALREAQELRLWRAYGYASLIEYMEVELGYEPRAAVERLRVAKAIEELPAIAEAMQQGDLCFSAAREITRVATPQTEGEWLAKIEEKNLRQIEDMVSGRERGDRPSDPVKPSLRRRKRMLDLRPETEAQLRQARKILEQQRGERLDDDAVISALTRLLFDAGRESSEHAQGRAPYQVAVVHSHGRRNTLSRAARRKEDRKWQRIGAQPGACLRRS